MDNSQFARDHWASFYDEINKKLDLKGKNILEIGCNNGYLLKKFLQNTSYHNILGIDSSLEMCDYASKNNKVNHGVFGSDYLKNNPTKGMDLIISNNVLNHSNNPVDFVDNVNLLLNNEGYFVFEIPYWGETVKSGNFDQIYHEHISYFTIKSVKVLLEKCNLTLKDIELIDYHGKSLRVYAQKNSKTPLPEYISNMIIKEEEKGLFCFNSDCYKQFIDNISKRKLDLLSKIIELKKDKNNIIVGVGAAAKANTLLTYYGLNNYYIDFITDNSKLKQNKFTPLTRIPIKDDTALKNIDTSKSIHVIILAWNISGNLKDKLTQINSNIKFI